MLSKAQSKYIRSLTQQKFRNEYNVFVAEGDKIAGEWVRSGQPLNMIVATDDWAAAHTADIARHPEAELCIVKDKELETLTNLQTANEVLLVAPPA